MSRLDKLHAVGVLANCARRAPFVMVLLLLNIFSIAPVQASILAIDAPVARDTAGQQRNSIIQLAQTGANRTCPPGTSGVYPNCRRNPPKPRCPRGTVGKWPLCIQIALPKKCSAGYYGTWPNCKRRVADPPRRCRKGYHGKPPNCRPNSTSPKNDIKTARPKSKPKRRKVKTVRKRRQSRQVRRTRVAAASATQRPDEVIVVLDRSVDPNAAFAIAQQYRLVRIEGQDINLISARVQRYRIPDRRSVEDVLGELANDPRIRLSQPNYIYRLLGASGDGKAKAKASAKSRMQYALAKLRLAQTHSLAKGRGVRIAVIDSGIDAEHGELIGAIAENYNAIKHVAPKADGHGTAVAGVIGARGDLTGIAPASELLAVRAFALERGASKPLATSYILPHAIDWAVENRARILNLSFVGPSDPLVSEALDAAMSGGVIVIAAAGNDGPDAGEAYPAAYAGVIAVTATDKNDKLYAKANQGTYVTIAAPGVGIFAPVPKGGYDFKTGTSFAAPHVSGLVALMLERRANMTAKDVRAALVNAAVDLGPPGPDPMYGSGRADALASVKAVIAGELTEVARGIALPTRPSMQPASGQ